MPSIVYEGSFGGLNATDNGRSASASSIDSATLPSNAVITNITYTLRLKSTKYSSSYAWKLHWLRVGEDGPEVTNKAVTMDGSTYEFSGDMTFSQSHASMFNSSTITVQAKANNTHPTAISYMEDFSVTVEYELATPPVLDSNFPMDASVLPGESAELRVVMLTEGYPASYTYQWYKDGELLADATESSLTVTPTGTAKYYCVVTHLTGDITTRTAVVGFASGVSIKVGDDWAHASAYVFVDGAWVLARPYVFKDGAWVVSTN